MTDNDIIKALECCNKSDNGKGCWECPYRQYCPDCLRRRNEDTIDLINRQKANAEGLTNAVRVLNEQLSSAKAEAYREFAERHERLLLSQLTTAPLDKKEWINFCLDELDNLKKEMVGEG